MDPISQAALGAIAARAAAPRHLLGPVLLCGAVAGALPDIDVVFSAPDDFFHMVRVHRGITHSLLFAVTAGPLLGWLISRWQALRHGGHGGHGGPPQAAGWMLAMTAAVLSHPLLDVLTPYGTQLLLPFSDVRLAIHAMPIIDPLYTGLLLAGCVWAARCSVSQRARSIAQVTLVLSCAYLALGWQLGVQARDIARADLLASGVVVDRIEAFPTLLQPWQRQVVARSGALDRVALMSMLAPCAPAWSVSTSASGAAVEALRNSEAGQTFDWFALGWVHYSFPEDRDLTSDGQSQGQSQDHIQDQAQRVRASDLRYVLSADAADSVFSVTARTRDDGAGRVVLAGIEDAGQRAADVSRLTQGLALVFDPLCRSAQMTQGEGGRRLDTLHGEG